MTRRQWLALTAGSSLASCAGRGKTIFFARDQVEIANPERGFYTQIAAENPGAIRQMRKNGLTLVLLTLDLRHYRSRTLDDAKLSVLDEALRIVRDSGAKAIFRAAYGFTDADYRADPADLGLIRQHIAGISGVLAKHAPWVFSVQAGMLGPWGEWHGSTHGDPPTPESRAAVLSAWCDGLPSSVFVQIRRPMFLRDLKACTDRVGFHNDALLALPDDMGTYAESGWDRRRELAWCAEHLSRVPFGGETVPASEGTPPATVLEELSLLRATYLNIGYHARTLDAWKRSSVEGGSLFDLVRNRLGHRIAPVRLESDGRSTTLVLRNDGFAPPLSPRLLSTAWIDKASRKVVGETEPSTVDCTQWKPESGEIRVALELPPNGSRTASLSVRFADVSEPLRSDGRHALRLASAEIAFDSENGWNLLPSDAG